MSNQPSIEKLPPQNLEAEQSLLGSLLIDKNAIIKVADIVCEDDFYEDRHRIIFSVISELYEKRQPIDLLNLSNRLKEKNKIKNIGGRTYLVTLTNAVPSASHVISYAEIVSKKATLRRLINASTEITSMAYDDSGEADKLLDEAEQKLFSVSRQHLKQNFVPIRDILDGAFDRIDDLHNNKGKLRGVPSGFIDLDKKLAGLQKSDLLILAARPSIGKTSLALDIARNVAKEKTPVGLFSLEMSKEQLVDRLICAEANVDLWKMRTGQLSTKEGDDDFARINYAMGELAEIEIYIDDSASANIMEIRTKARRLKMEHDIGLVVIDYLQLMEGRKNDNRVQEISEISRALKGLARELNIPVLALSQLSRGVESRTPPIPKLADLRESGSIEQDADVVMFIYREDYYKKDSSKPNVAEIHIAKHRNGPTGIVDLYFEANQASFKSLDKTNLEEKEPFN
ncbi:replicative DNA helicase [Candidatus Falkowbacteria bacterium]|jgi:replicative DNA helicase|nr:replicative DNA helicase [Candidatus Falkowbacteria bacterium]MBT4433147.1 replicative DNA helicase [Candidatus Falkowbacteria bacterium]